MKSIPGEAAPAGEPLIMLSRLSVVSLLFFAFLFPACAQKPVVRPAEIEPYAGPVTVEILKQQIALRNVASVKALTEVRVFRKGEPEGSFSGVFGYRSPESMRISLFGPFGLTVMDFLVADRMLQMYLAPKNTLYEWESADVPLLTMLDNRFTYVLQDDDTAYVLLARSSEAVDDAGITTKYLFDKTYLRNTAAVFYRDGLEFARADFGTFNGKFPEQISLSFRNRSRIEISLSETEFDTEIPDEYFVRIDRNGKKIRPFQDFLKRLDPNR